MRILLVEDSRAVAAVMTMRLAAFGYEVSVAANGEIAVAMFATLPPDLMPDLILMDVQMPVMNGFEAAARIRAIEATRDWAWTPIVFLTASSSPDTLVTAIEAGGDDFIVKSAPESVLRAKMKAMTRIAALRARLSVANRLLSEQASRDGLTGLLNRRHMDLTLDQAWNAVCGRGQPFGLMMIDIDHFKKYNDHYGHLAGDDCLCTVAKALEGVVKRFNADVPDSGVFVARYGGEEFAVVMPAVSSGAFHATAGAIIDAVRSLAVPHERNAEWGIVTASLGGVHVERADDDLVALFRTADARLYRAKEAGRNCVVLN
jgi:diguanylate cyclase (GGDEF)-like protein